MKKTFLVVVIIATTFTQHIFAQDNSNQLSQILTLYYGVKDALIAGDGNTASAKATEMLKVINSVDVNKLSEGDQKAYKPVQYKLEYDTRHISEVKDISHQREHFQSLSLNMYTLSKAAKLSQQPVYQEYCPMKNAYWLSNEAAIKNPYFGNQMLTCGKVADTIK